MNDCHTKHSYIYVTITYLIIRRLKWRGIDRRQTVALITVDLRQQRTRAMSFGETFHKDMFLL